MDELAELKQHLETQHYLMKAILLKAGGDLTITKEEFMAAQGMHFQMTRWEKETRVLLQESNRNEKVA